MAKIIIKGNAGKITDAITKLARCTGCEYLHKNGNCLKIGGYFSSIDDKYCPKTNYKINSLKNKEVINMKEVLDFIYTSNLPVTYYATADIKSLPDGIIYGDILKLLKKITGLKTRDIQTKLPITDKQLRKAEKLTTSKFYEPKNKDKLTKEDKEHMKIHQIQLDIFKYIYKIDEEMVYKICKVWSASHFNFGYIMPIEAVRSLEVNSEMEKLEVCKDFHNLFRYEKSERKISEFTIWKYEFVLHIAKCVQLIRF